MKKDKRTTITINEELHKEIQKLKKGKYFDKPYAEIYRMLLQKGLESYKEKPSARKRGLKCFHKCT